MSVDDCVCVCVCVCVYVCLCVCETVGYLAIVESTVVRAIVSHSYLCT